jgi:tRNA 2-selenouridine synthase
MKHPLSISVADYLANPARFSCVLDARTPAEFALDHLPAAQSAPVLDDAQRVTIGTLDKQVSSFEAKRQGAALVSRNIASLLDSPAFAKGRDWAPLVYCWRGGNRSGSLAHVLRKIGWASCQLEGGYKAFRGQVIADLETLPQTLNYRVIAGPTGVGKTHLLKALAAQGAQVLCLETIAQHRGSLLGAMAAPQPSQKAFETQIWQALRGFDPARPIFVESESAKVGNVRVPEALLMAVRASPCINLSATTPQRVALLCAEYTHFLSDASELNRKLAALTQTYGTEKITTWQTAANEQAWPELVEDLLSAHYDPAYHRSLQKNYAQIDSAQKYELAGIEAKDFDALAQEILTDSVA